jgi:hypothetical protein
MPGFVSPCPAGFKLPFDSWLTIAWVTLAVLGLEVGLLVFNLVRSDAGLRQWGSGGTTLALALAVVTACALVALALAFSLQQQNLHLCFAGDVRATPEVIAARLHAIQEATPAARMTFAAILGVAAVGTLVTLVALVRRPRGARAAGVRGTAGA